MKNNAAIAFEIAVPNAAPTTSKCKPKIKIGSKMMLIPTLESIPIIEIIGFPMALANCSKTKNRITNGVLKNSIFK